MPSGELSVDYLIFLYGLRFAGRQIVMSTLLQGRLRLDIRNEVSNGLDSVENFEVTATGRLQEEAAITCQDGCRHSWSCPEAHTHESCSPQGLILCPWTMDISSLLLVLSQRPDGKGRGEVWSHAGASPGLDKGCVENCHGNLHSLCPSFSIAFVF